MQTTARTRPTPAARIQDGPLRSKRASGAGGGFPGAGMGAEGAGETSVGSITFTGAGGSSSGKGGGTSPGRTLA
jgi:hypothetical protein